MSGRRARTNFIYAHAGSAVMSQINNNDNIWGLFPTSHMSWDAIPRTLQSEPLISDSNILSSFATSSTTESSAHGLQNLFPAEAELKGSDTLVSCHTIQENGLPENLAVGKRPANLHECKSLQEENDPMGSDEWSIATILKSIDSAEICSPDQISPISRSDRSFDAPMDNSLVSFCTEEMSDAVGLGFVNENNLCSPSTPKGHEEQVFSDDELFARPWEVESRGDMIHEAHTLPGSVTSFDREQDQLPKPGSEIYNNLSATDSEHLFHDRYDTSQGIVWNMDFETDYDWFQDHKYRSETHWPFLRPCTDGGQISLAILNSPLFGYMPHTNSSLSDGFELGYSQI
jgi:hypothetical protein